MSRLRTRHRVALAAVCVAILVLISSCAEGVRQRNTIAFPMERFTVAATPYVGNCSVVAADANGYFASEGLQVEVLAVATGKDALTHVMRGQADVATVADVPIMLAVLAGEPVTVVATISTAARDHAIVAKRDRGIRTPQDLRGKRIGVPTGTSADFFADAFLYRQKISPKRVRMKNMEPQQLAGALLAGEIDAMAIWQPFVDEGASRLGTNASVFYGEGVYDVMYNLAATTHGMARRQRAFERFLRAVARGAEFCRNETQSAQMVVSRKTGMDSARVGTLWPAYTFRIGLAQALLVALEQETRWAIRSKLSAVSSPPNYLDHLEPGPLAAVMPAAVTVIH